VSDGKSASFVRRYAMDRMRVKSKYVRVRDELAPNLPHADCFRSFQTPAVKHAIENC